jgi:hypothetical protein
MHYENVFWDPVLMRSANRYPSILAIGDSWFFYPFPGGSLLNRLGPMVAPREHVILAIGNNGAEAYDYVQGKYARHVRSALALYADSLSAIFISGGGNDFAGINDLRPLLLDDCSACESPAACFRPGQEVGGPDWLLDRIERNYTALIEEVRAAVVAARGDRFPGMPAIVLHNYDYARPTGDGLFGPRSSPWLLPAFLAARVPGSLRAGCIQLLLDRFTQTLRRVASRYSAQVRLVDSRNTLTMNDWANELHPTSIGFDKIAQC